MQWGSRFHLLMQQRELALPIEPFLADNPELNSAVKDLIEAVPELIESPDRVWRKAEHPRSLGYGNFVLTVIYDLLVTREDKATILDWKTYSKPEKRNRLASNWQTRLYLYVLIETSEYTPEQVQMIYWFVKSGKPTKIDFQYNWTLHQQTEKDLERLLSQLEIWLQNYQRDKIDFPHKPDCENCPYRESLCPKDSSQIRHLESIEAIAQIREISI